MNITSALGRERTAIIALADRILMLECDVKKTVEVF